MPHPVVAHKVTFSLPERELGHADIEFLVRSNGSVIGKLLVSKGRRVEEEVKVKKREEAAWLAGIPRVDARAHGRRER